MESYGLKVTVEGVRDTSIETLVMQGGAKEDLVHLKQVGKACDACRKERKTLGMSIGMCWVVNLFLRNLDWGSMCQSVGVFCSNLTPAVCSAVSCQKSRRSDENAVG